ncbi:hypothetical protein KAI58_03755 [Candidatus Gracilibacteria bacterium]|nr:hypothetical protein [Candidatus Gracilibacteria bacterium]
MTKQKNRIQKKGYVTLIAVLIVGVVVFAISTAVVLMGLDMSRTSFSLEQSFQTKRMANLCVETALEEIRKQTTFAIENEQINFTPQGNCVYTVIVNSGENRTIEVIGTLGEVVSKIQIEIDAINPYIHIDSWQEVADF